MEIKEFISLMGNIDTDTYPFGSCQYRTVQQGFEAAKQATIPEIIGLFDEGCILRVLSMKGKKDVILREMKETMIFGHLKTRDEQHAEEQLKRVAFAVLNYADNAILEEDLWEDHDREEIKEIIQAKDCQELITWMSEHAYDLWSISLPVCSPQLDKTITPDVGDGPIFNMMAWEEGYATGVELALFEYIYEEEMDWEEWDT